MKKTFLAALLMTAIQFNVPAQQHFMDPHYSLSGIMEEPHKPLTLMNKTNIAGYDNPLKDHDHYMRQSKTLRITGLSLLGLGLGLGIGGVITVSSNDYYNENTASSLFISSAIAGVASIPLMVLAHASRNKAKAALTNQKTFIPGKGDKNLVGLTLSLPINK